MGTGATVALIVAGMFAAGVIRRATRRRDPNDLAVTALYTSAAWSWAKLPGAELLFHRRAKAVFDGTNLALALPRALGRAPWLPASLVQRHLMIDRLVSDSGATEILELAAGLSRRGVAMSTDPRVSFTEVDRPFVVQRKRALLERTAAGRAALARPNFRLVEGDVADVDLAALGSGTRPRAIVAEGLLMYLDSEAQRTLFRRIRALFDARSGLFVFDLVPAAEQVRRGALGSALGWFFRRATRGARFARDARTRDDVASDLRAAGFSVELLEPKDVLDRWQLPYGDVWTQVLLFVCRPA